MGKIISRKGRNLQQTQIEEAASEIASNINAGNESDLKIELLRYLSRKGDPKSLFELGKAFEEKGKYKLAGNYYKKALQNGYIEAASEIGRLYYEHKVGSTNFYEKAYVYFSFYEKERPSMSNYYLGLMSLNNNLKDTKFRAPCYYWFEGINSKNPYYGNYEALANHFFDKNNEEEALGFLLEGYQKTKNDHLLFMYSSKSFYSENKDISNKALKNILSLASRNNEDAIIFLMNLYTSHKYMIENTDVGIYYAFKAREHHSVKALIKLVDIFSNGKYIEPSEEIVESCLKELSDYILNDDLYKSELSNIEAHEDDIVILGSKARDAYYALLGGEIVQS